MILNTTSEPNLPVELITDHVRLLVVVEGTNDVEFLRRISLMLSAHDPTLPNLASMEQTGELVFLPFGGGHVKAWCERLAPLARPEFHLYDHELPPETDQRLEAAEIVNHRLHCHAVITQKRSLENYLHPSALAITGNVHVEFDDFDCVSAVVAKAMYQRGPGQLAWQLQSQRARSRMTNRTKRWLNTVVAEHMTPELLAERDPAGEVISWLQRMALMASDTQHQSLTKGK